MMQQAAVKDPRACTTFSPGNPVSISSPSMFWGEIACEWLELLELRLVTLPVYTASSVFPCRGGVWRKSELCWVCIWHRGRTLWPKCWRDADSGESSWCRRSPRDTANCISSGCGIFQILGENRERKVIKFWKAILLLNSIQMTLEFYTFWTHGQSTSAHPQSYYAFQGHGPFLPGLLKSGIPLGVLIPAPAMTNMFSALAISFAISGTLWLQHAGPKLKFLLSIRSSRLFNTARKCFGGWIWWQWFKYIPIWKASIFARWKTRSWVEITYANVRKLAL